MGTEFELKYVAEESAFDGLKLESDHWQTYQMATTYYDTPDALLGKLRWTLRRRFENGVSVCTLKTPAGGHGRNEYELECGDIHTALPLLVEAGAPAELLTLTAGGIQEVCAARFHRLAGQVLLGDTTVELALDKGVLLGGGRELPFVEVEVELKSGDQATAVAYAQALAAKFNLRPEPKSKYKRALMLAGKA
ncbi:MAG: CYTH domain-containing protein [Oscillospiraceae bacterium]|nr:CYTH domain-containing protein [Oscillospiraceae bacterium]